MNYKLIYLARRNPVIPAAEFGAAWLSHARYAADLSSSFASRFKSARQCVKLHAADVPSSFRNDHDGVALLTMRDWASLEAARRDPIAADELKRDEERVFAGHVDPWTMPVEEHVAYKAGAGHVCILSFLKPDPECGDAAFDGALAHACEAIPSLPALRDRLTRLVRNRVIERRAPPYDFAAVLELWFADEAAALAAAHDDAVIAAIEQAPVADVAKGVRLVAGLNLPSEGSVDEGTAAVERQHRAGDI